MRNLGLVIPAVHFMFLLVLFSDRERDARPLKKGITRDLQSQIQLEKAKAPLTPSYPAYTHPIAGIR